LALDGTKRVCGVRSSNAGHCLYAGIVGEERAHRLAATLTSDKLFSGWGVRTIALDEARYDPRSYHNGSIWPHDNALVAAGLARYGFTREAARIFIGLFDATSFFELHRLPELFCGFPRDPDQGPTLSSVSCSPQTWASCAIFLLLGASLGLEIDVSKREIAFTNPYLPEFLPDIEIKQLRIGQALVDLRLTGMRKNVMIEVPRREGEVQVVVVEN
jgi:glycogen debranching enzyme